MPLAIIILWRGYKYRRVSWEGGPLQKKITVWDHHVNSGIAWSFIATEAGRTPQIQVLESIRVYNGREYGLKMLKVKILVNLAMRF